MSCGIDRVAPGFDARVSCILPVEYPTGAEGKHPRLRHVQYASFLNSKIKLSRPISGFTRSNVLSVLDTRNGATVLKCAVQCCCRAI